MRSKRKKVTAASARMDKRGAVLYSVYSRKSSFRRDCINDNGSEIRMSDDKRFGSEESVAAYGPIRGWRRIGCLAVVFVVGGAMYAGYELWLDRCPLVAIEKKDISSIQATTWLKRPDDRVKFAVSRELGLEMIALLEPNHVDLYPAKWVGLGVLNIELTRGARYLVILYETHGEEVPSASTVGTIAAGRWMKSESCCRKATARQRMSRSWPRGRIERCGGRALDYQNGQGQRWACDLTRSVRSTS